MDKPSFIQHGLLLYRAKREAFGDALAYLEDAWAFLEQKGYAGPSASAREPIQAAGSGKVALPPAPPRPAADGPAWERPSAPSQEPAQALVCKAQEAVKAYAHLLKFKPDDQELALRLEIARLELAALVDPGGAATAERLERARAMLAELNPPKPKPKPKTGD